MRRSAPCFCEGIGIEFTVAVELISAHILLHRYQSSRDLVVVCGGIARFESSLVRITEHRVPRDAAQM